VLSPRVLIITVLIIVVVDSIPIPIAVAGSSITRQLVRILTPQHPSHGHVVIQILSRPHPIHAPRSPCARCAKHDRSEAGAWLWGLWELRCAFAGLGQHI
jgi:hypothetical protein